MSLKTQKLGSLFTKEISRIILEEVKNPKIKFVTITDCDITNDLSYAKVSFLTLNREDKEEIEKALNSAANFIEISLSKCIDIISSRTSGAAGVFIISNGFRNKLVYYLGEY